MPFVSIQGRAPNKAQLSQYIRTVRGMAGLGMGDDVVDPVTGEITSIQPVTAGSDFPVTTGSVPLMPDITTSVQTATAAATSPSSGGGFNISTFLNSLTGAAGAGAKLYQQLQGPSLVPGTNAIYNAATGQYYNPTTGQVVNPVGAALSSIPFSSSGSLLLIGGLAIGGLLLFSMLGKR